MSDRLLSLAGPDELLEAVAARAAELVLERLEAVARSGPSPWLSLGEAAEYLRVSERKLQRLVAKGRVRSTTVGRRRLFHRDELDAYARDGDGGGVARTAPPRRREE